MFDCFYFFFFNLIVGVAFQLDIANQRQSAVEIFGFIIWYREVWPTLIPWCDANKSIFLRIYFDFDSDIKRNATLKRLENVFPVSSRWSSWTFAADGQRDNQIIIRGIIIHWMLFFQQTPSVEGHLKTLQCVLLPGMKLQPIAMHYNRQNEYLCSHFLGRELFQIRNIWEQFLSVSLSFKYLVRLVTLRPQVYLTVPWSAGTPRNSSIKAP